MRGSTDYTNSERQDDGGEKPVGNISFPVWTRHRANSSSRRTFWQKGWIFAQILLFLVVALQVIMYRTCILAAAAALAGAEPVLHRAVSSSSSRVPDYYITKPELVPGTHQIIH